MGRAFEAPEGYTGEKVCPACFQTFNRKMGEGPARFAQRTYCDRKCSTRSTAPKALATRKRAMLKF